MTSKQGLLSPAANNPSGFFLADVPVDKVEALAGRDYVERLDTAEKQSGPQGMGNKPD